MPSHHRKRSRKSSGDRRRIRRKKPSHHSSTGRGASSRSEPRKSQKKRQRNTPADKPAGFFKAIWLAIWGDPKPKSISKQERHTRSESTSKEKTSRRRHDRSRHRERHVSSASPRLHPMIGEGVTEKLTPGSHLAHRYAKPSAREAAKVHPEQDGKSSVDPEPRPDPEQAENRSGHRGSRRSSSRRRRSRNPSSAKPLNPAIEESVDSRPGPSPAGHRGRYSRGSVRGSGSSSSDGGSRRHGKRRRRRNSKD